jgi:hypothetical protein
MQGTAASVTLPPMREPGQDRATSETEESSHGPYFHHADTAHESRDREIRYPVRAVRGVRQEAGGARLQARARRRSA